MADSTITREMIGRVIALHGLGTITGGDRLTAPPGWSTEEWRARILEVSPVVVENRCLAAADEILALISLGQQPVAFTCAALRWNTGANDPQGCDWPTCGCDPYADKVIAALQESGALATGGANG